jgi:hypothetical protein
MSVCLDKTNKMIISQGEPGSHVLSLPKDHYPPRTSGVAEAGDAEASFKAGPKPKLRLSLSIFSLVLTTAIRHCDCTSLLHCTSRSP